MIKSQCPRNLQYPNPNSRRISLLGIWSFLGHRTLDIGHSRLLLALLLTLFLTACTSTDKKPNTSPARITELHMLAVPVALNLDPLPGPDSVAVKIYAGNLREAKPIPITAGTLELMMFDGLLKKSTNVPKPLHTWTYPARELQRYQFKASIGIGYEFTASWTTNKPAAVKISLISRYVPESGPPIYSAPSTISVTGH